MTKITDEQVKAAMDVLLSPANPQQQYKSVVRAAHEAADAAAWRPIEQAPKDGGAILVWAKGNNTRLVAWDDWVSLWIISGGDSDFLRYEPTHFRHLPEPPKEPQ